MDRNINVTVTHVNASKVELCKDIFNSMTDDERKEFLNIIIRDDIDLIKYDTAHLIGSAERILHTISNLIMFNKEDK